MNDHNKIFISHASGDEKIATEIKLFLEDLFLNVHVYVSGKDSIGGETWIEGIKSRLKSCNIIISLLTSKSLSNNWVYFESGAGFIDDKTIPLLTDNIKLSDLTPPMSLLQTRTLTASGIEKLISDISNKLDQREPKKFPNPHELIDKVEKLLRGERVLLLKEMLPKIDSAPNAKKQWIFEENCLVYEYIIEEKYNIAIDTYFYIDKTEIQLFGREGAEEFLLNTLCKAKGFLPLPFNNYELKGDRLIFKIFETNEKIENVATELNDLLSRVEIYKSKV